MSSSELFDRDRHKGVVQALEDTLNKKGSVLPGGVFITGIIASFEENKESLVGDALTKLVPTLRDCGEVLPEERLFILNTNTKHVFTLDLSTCYLGQTKLVEFSREKVTRATLKLQGSFNVKLESLESDWEDQAVRALKDELRNRTYSVEGKGLWTIKSQALLPTGTELAVSLLKTPWDKESEQKSPFVKEVNLCLVLEALVPQEGSFSSLLESLLLDLERTLVDRLFTNLDHAFIHLPKRALLRTHGGLLSTSLLILPGQSIKEVITENPNLSHLDIFTPEGIYGEPSHKLENTNNSNSDPLLGQSIQKSENNNSINSAAIDAASSVSQASFELGSRELLLTGVVAVLVIVYVYITFLS